ncbi:MAG: 16S rRNA (uracil(1498)-N(3))-methyltransferase [Bacteroidota bacterium]|nr:16S rRNA (uracil(1498)-N(3))-methyltransferase [Bacteroidota bacterium]
MHLFYTPDLNDTIYTLNEQESKHCIKVLRLSTNDMVQLIDGKGGFFTAKIMEPDPKKCTVEIVETKKDYEKRNHRLHIAIAPTKNNDRLEWFLEKATEIGIDEITPIVCEHSERKVIKPERLEKILVSAMKQSIKAYKPQLNDLIKYTDFIKNPFAGEKFIAHCEDHEKSFLKSRYTVGRDVLILIGPEGDFSREEIDEARQNNFTEISLGNSRLRTETAGVVACHTINLLNEKEVN